MSFKIVQTIERGEALLSIVPRDWECGGTLFWPNTKKVSLINKLIQSGNSRPEADWTSQPCVKKREKIMSFEGAEAELKTMEGNSDTDGYIVDTPQIKKRGKTTTIVTGSDIIECDFNQYICNQDTVHQSGFLQPQLSSPILTPIQSGDWNNPINIIEEPEEVDAGIIFKNIAESLPLILEKLDTIMQELAKQNAFNDIVMDRINVLHEDINNKNNRSAVETMTADIGVLIEPISSPSQIEEIEIQLNDTKKMEDLVTRMKNICGSSGTADAINCCYRLVDHFFDRDFLLEVTWSGGSRTESKKLAMKNYPNILTAFNSVIKLAATDLNEQKSKDFFSTVLRNAKTRSEKTNRLRRSSTRKVYPAKQTEQKVTTVTDATTGSIVDNNAATIAPNMSLEATDN